MKNIELRNVIINYVNSKGSQALIDNIITLIQSLPKGLQENTLALIMGEEQLKVKSTDEVTLICRKRDCMEAEFYGKRIVNFIEETITVKIKYKKFAYDISGYGCGYIMVSRLARVTFNLYDWNTGNVIWK